MIYYKYMIGTIISYDILLYCKYILIISIPIGTIDHYQVPRGGVTDLSVDSVALWHPRCQELLQWWRGPRWLTVNHGYIHNG